jgi:CcmD family protein
MKKIALSILLINLFASTFAQSQEAQGVFEKHDKFYVVIGIIVIIFLLIVAYLFKLDNKISKLEKKD